LQFAEQSRRLRGRNVLNARNMKNGALNIFLSEGAGIQSDADLNGVPFDERHIVIWNVECPAIRKGDPEGPEWNCIHALVQLHCGYHELEPRPFPLQFQAGPVGISAFRLHPLAFKLSGV
jgi:hypothetical protein